MEPAAELKELLLREPRWTLGVAESLTCGRLQALVGAVSGASAYFTGGLTAYTLEQKVRTLGVNHAQAEATNCVGAEIAEQMARGACALFETDMAVATTGYAEPDPARGIRIPLLWWAVCRRLNEERSVVQSGRLEMPGATRTQAQERAAAEALARLVDFLREARS